MSLINVWTEHIEQGEDPGTSTDLPDPPWPITLFYWEYDTPPEDT